MISTTAAAARMLRSTRDAAGSTAANGEGKLDRDDMSTRGSLRAAWLMDGLGELVPACGLNTRERALTRRLRRVPVPLIFVGASSSTPSVRLELCALPRSFTIYRCLSSFRRSARVDGLRGARRPRQPTTAPTFRRFTHVSPQFHPRTFCRCIALSAS